MAAKIGPVPQMQEEANRSWGSQVTTKIPNERWKAGLPKIPSKRWRTAGLPEGREPQKNPHKRISSVVVKKNCLQAGYDGQIIL